MKSVTSSEIQNELSERVRRFARRLNESGVDIAILTSPSNIRYFSDFRMNRSAGSILTLDRSGVITYIVPQLDFERTKRRCWIDNILAFPEDSPDCLSVLSEIPGKKPCKVGVEPAAITYDRVKQLARIWQNDTAFISVETELANLRLIKSDREIRRIRRAARIVDRAMAAAITGARHSQDPSEADVCAHLEREVRRNGGEGTAFEPFVMSGINSWLPQRIASGKKLREKELVVFDAGAVWEGYCSDMTRTFRVGRVSSRQRRIFDVALNAQQEAVNAIMPGKKAWEIDAIARDIIEKEGFGSCFPHITGHGIGLSIHEQPILDRDSQMVLAPNMVVTVEPGVYLPDIGGARIEDMVLVTETGCEVITETAREL